MSSRTGGVVAIAVGLVLVVLSLIGLLTGGDDTTAVEATTSGATNDTAAPTSTPIPLPTATPESPTAEPVADPTSVPTSEPVADPTASPTPVLTEAPSPTPEPSPTPDTEALTLEWVAAQSQAFVDGDSELLLARLHPATINRYGEEQCRSYLESILPQPALTLRSYLGLEAWDYTTDDVSESFADAIAAEIERDVDGQTIIQEVHYALVDGEIRWLSDCGDPVVG